MARDEASSRVVLVRGHWLPPVANTFPSTPAFDPLFEAGWAQRVAFHRARVVTVKLLPTAVMADRYCGGAGIVTRSHNWSGPL